MKIELLNSLAREEYSPWRIPGPRDSEISALISEVSTAQECEQLNRSLTLASARILSAFAYRSASWAVRIVRRFPIERGIVAALLAVGVEDDREIIPGLSLLLRAAELIDADPVAMFDDASDILGSRAARLAHDFAHGDPADRSIEVMGYIEARDDTGFRFCSTL